VKALVCIISCMLAAGYYGCAPSRNVTKERNLPVEEVLRRVRERNGGIRTLEGEGSITIESPEASHRGSFNMRLKKPDSLRVELSGPFGIHVGTLMLSRERFIYYSWMENTAVIGKPDSKTLNSVLRLKMQFDDIIRAFTGEFPTPGGGDSVEQFTVEDGLYLVRYQTGEGRKEARIDGDAFIVTSYRVLDEFGKPSLTAIASEAEDAENIAVPRMLRVIFPKERRSITIAYDNVKLNEPVVCSFVLPKKAEVINR